MSSELSPSLGLGDEDATRLGEDAATRIRTFRLILVLAQELRTLMDQQLRPDNLTTQQAALISVVDAIGRPSLSQAAAALATSRTGASADLPQHAGATTRGDDAPPPIRSLCSPGSPLSTRAKRKHSSLCCSGSKPQYAPPSRRSPASKSLRVRRPARL